MTVPFFFHLILFLLPSPAFLTQDAALLSMSQRISRNTKPQPIKVVVSEPCLQGSEPCDPSEARGKEVELEPGAPLILTHRIRLVPGSGSGCSGCEADFAALRARLERLEREVSELREKCGGPEGGCCTSQQIKGAGCTTVRPPTDECPDDCSDQGQCVDGKCVCFPGFSGLDCSESNCPGNCNNKGKCVNGQCVCDPGFTGPDCSQAACPGNCNKKGRCVNGKCVCDSGFTGPDCSSKACPKNCSNRGRCVNGKCVCDSGFTGPDCSARSCPKNCSNRGRCVNGKCVCESGFAGPDCSERSCPGNCNNRGRCVNGQCVCESGFAGPDCSERSCPGNCNNKGRCVNGKCVCEVGYTGPDCSERTCPGNCNNKGRCVNGQCVCDAGFTGPDCSEKTCPGNCNNKGRCVNGQCVCDPGFTGPDCSTKSCPNDCSDQGQCVDGQCVCEDGFTGPDCSERSCPNNCSNKGRCVNGKCVCDVGFTGQDCSTKTCPNNCSNRGRCVKGRCVCRRGFTGPDCSECEDGFTGPDCATALTGVARLSTRNITESSVTLFWTPPTVQYDTYHITFTSKKESDQKVVTKVSGRLTAYTQIGLAAGQQYMVTIVGEKDGKTGAESVTEFQTLISGPKDLEVVKTSTTSVIVQWDQALGEIDRYILFVSPNQTDGSGKGSQEMKLPPERDSAQIDGLEPGRLYDISLVAEKVGARSLPATVQATPGATTKELPGMETVTMQAALRNDSSDGKTAETKLNRTALFLKNQALGAKRQRKPLGAQDPGRPRNISIPRSSIQTGQGMSTQPGQSKPGSRPDTIRRPNGMLRYNGTRIDSRGGKIGVYPLRKLPFRRYPAEGPKGKTPSIPSGLQHPSTRDSTMAPAIETGHKEQNVESHSAVEPVSPVGKTSIEGPLSQHHPVSSQKSPVSGEEPLEPTITTEKNITALINGTKCVRKVLVGHRTIHINGKSGEKAQTKNMTVIVGHVNGNYILHKLLLGSAESSTPSILERATLSGELTGKRIEKKPMEDKQKQKKTKVAGEGEEEAGTMTVTSWPTSYTPEAISENFRRVSTQEEEVGAGLPHSSAYSTPPPSLPQASHSLQSILLPPEKQKNMHPIRASSKIPPQIRRFPTGPKSSGPSAPGIKKTPTFRSNTGPFQNQPKPILKHPRYPYRSPPLRPILPNIPDTDNSTVMQTAPHNQAASENNSSSQNGLNPKPTFMFRRKNGSVIRLPLNRHRVIKPSATKIHSGPKDSKHEARGEDTVTLTTAKPAVKADDRIQDVAEESEDTSGHNLPRVTNSSHPNPRPIDKDASQDPGLGLVTDKHTSQDPKPGLVTNNGAEKDPKSGLVTDKGPGQDPELGLDTDQGTRKDPEPGLDTDQGTKKDPEPGLVTDKGPRKASIPGLDTDQGTKKDPEHVLAKDKGPRKAPISGVVTDKGARKDPEPGLAKDKGPRKAPLTGLAKDKGPRKAPLPGLATDKAARQEQEPGLAKDKGPIQAPVPGLATDKSARKEPEPGLVTDKDPMKTPVPGLATDKGPRKAPVPGLVTDKGSRKAPVPGLAKDKGPRKAPVPGLATDKGPRKAPVPGLVTDKGSKKAPVPGLAKDKGPRKAPVPGLAKDKGPRKAPVPGLAKDKGPRKAPVPGLVTDKGPRKAPVPGLAKDKGVRQPYKLPLVTEEDATQHSTVALSTNKTSEDGIDHAGVQNVTSKGFIIIWASPKGMFQNFIISLSRHGQTEQAKQDSKEEEGHKRDGGDVRSLDDVDESKEKPNVLGSPTDSHTVRRNGSDAGGIRKFTKVLPGSARSYPVTDLTPQTGYSVSLFGKGLGLRSSIHSFIIRTGPEPPSNLAFSEVTDSSLKVSWTRPKSPVSGFKVTYTHAQDGEPVSVTVNSTNSTLPLSKLSPGSTYEVSVISVLGLDESDPINGIVLTLPDPPTDLSAINVTDTKALLLWRPALATVDQYVIVYGSEEVPGSELTIKVSGNAAEQQLQSLKANTKYTVTIISQLGDHKSPGAITIFTTTSGSGGRGEGPRDLTASQVTPHTAVLSWKPPASAVMSYKLTYFTESREMKEVILDPGVTEYKLTGLHPSSAYTAQLQGQRGGLYTAAISTEFTTGYLRFPFPNDCSQEMLNGVRTSGVVEIFPLGKEGKPVRVYCDMETDGGGWTVFQRRKDGKTNFFRSWPEYSKGFGELDGEFWLGNELLHNLTTTTPMTMRVDLRTGDEAVYAFYSTFSVDTMKKHYMVRVSGYSGTAGDSMKYHDRRPFSTWDRDPQPFITRCAMSYRGGWWYKNCHEANLNGLYNTHTNHQGVIWTAWKGKDFSIPFSEMKLRPASFNPRTQG